MYVAIMSVAIRGIHREYARPQGHVQVDVKTPKKAKKGESLFRP